MGSSHSRRMQLLAGLCRLTWEQLLPQKESCGPGVGRGGGRKAACPITNAERLKPGASEPRALSGCRETTDLAGVQVPLSQEAGAPPTFQASRRPDPERMSRCVPAPRKDVL